MDDFYKPLNERTPDYQYQDVCRLTLQTGEVIGKTAQGVGALTLFGRTPKMIFELNNGTPLITERKIGFWRKPIAEILGFAKGARTIKEIEAHGCDVWKDYDKDVGIGLPIGDLGPGSYGPAFHDFPMPDGKGFNQFESLVEQIQNFPTMRTHCVTSWIPFYTPRGPLRKVNVAPCHGNWIQVRVINGRLDMVMVQRSADLPIGVPCNMIQYAALQLMLCQVTGYRPGTYIHDLVDAHIYETQIKNVRELVLRPPRPFPLLRLDPSVKNLFDFKPEHFTLEEYNPHPAILGIPYHP